METKVGFRNTNRYTFPHPLSTGGGGDPLPVISSVSPDNGAQGATVAVVLTGSGFDVGGAAVTVSGSGVSTSGLSVVDDTEINVNFVITGGAAAGTRNVTVTTDAGSSNTESFTVTTSPGGPVLTSVSPNIWYQGTRLTLTLIGTAFDGGSGTAALSSENGVTLSGCVVGSATSITCTVTSTITASVFSRQIYVTTSAGTSNTADLTLLPAGTASSGRLRGR